MKNIQLLNDRILVLVEENKKTSESGFILPEKNDDDKLRFGKVIAVGNGSRNEDGERIPMEIKTNDKILFEYSTYSSKEVEFDKKKYLLISERDVVAIIKE